MFIGPVGPVEVFFFTGPKSLLGIFYRPGVSGSLLAPSAVGSNKA